MMKNDKTYLNKIGKFKIKLPFVLNSQQKEVIEKIDKFIQDPFETVMTISGWAGTGKTTLMEIVKNRYWYTGPNIHFAATTHKAAAVLKQKVKKRVSTVNSLFGILIEIDMDNDAFDVSKKKKVYDTEKLKEGSVVVIDEASMLSESNYNDVIKKCKDYNCKVIFVGDSAQLAPVNEDDISIVFRNQENDSKQIIELTKIERTDEVPILNEATRVRLEGELSYMSNIVDGNGVRYISNGEEIVETIDKYIGGLKDNPNYFRILTYTNKNVENLNTIIRKKLGYNDIPEVGEPLMSYANWGYDGGTYTFINSESYNVNKIIGERDVELAEIIDTYDGDKIMHIIDMEIVDSLGKKIVIPYLDIKNNPNNRSAVEIVCREKINAWKRYRNIDASALQDKIERRKCLDYINELDDLIFVNDNVRDWNGYLIQSKVVDFGYAHTIHKSQGCTFENILMNDIDISHNCHDNMTRKQLRYVGITRAKKNVIVLTDISPENLDMSKKL
ncbi:MAG: DEAD/DEAH box helicase [Lachnospiraceae bacterium]|nr:DEAD/DEAH box helicase [Lachnospiraceae bacterium]MCM1236300.1 DEAD/DEAH box helicase [Ruminococcus flavefaciens]